MRQFILGAKLHPIRSKRVDDDEPMILLTEEQAALVEALDSLGLGFVYSDGARVLYASRTFADITGYTVDQILTMSDPYLIVVARDRDRLRAYNIEWMSGRSVSPSLDISLETADGSEKRVALAVQRVAAEGGRFHVLVIIVDVDAPVAPRVGEYDLALFARAIADGADEPFMVVLDNGRALMANGAARELAASARWHPFAPSILHVLHAAGVRRPAEVLDRAREGGVAVPVGGVVEQTRYDILIVPTARSYVLWWREAQAPSAGAQDRS